MGETGRRCRDVQRVLGEEEEWEHLPLLRLAVAFRALRLDRWREHRRENSREDLPGWLAGSSSPSPPGWFGRAKN